MKGSKALPQSQVDNHICDRMAAGQCRVWCTEVPVSGETTALSVSGSASRQYLTILAKYIQMIQPVFKVTGVEGLDPQLLSLTQTDSIYPHFCWRSNVEVLYLLLLRGDLLTDRCRTDDLMPSIPVVCLPPCRVDPKVLGLRTFSLYAVQYSVIDVLCTTVFTLFGFKYNILIGVYIAYLRGFLGNS